MTYHLTPADLAAIDSPVTQSRHPRGPNPPEERCAGCGGELEFCPECVEDRCPDCDGRCVDLIDHIPEYRRYHLAADLEEAEATITDLTKRLQQATLLCYGGLALKEVEIDETSVGVVLRMLLEQLVKIKAITEAQP